MTAAPSWSIVIVSFNAGPLLGRCVETVLDAAGGRSVEVVVVDNASGDDSLGALPDDARVRTLVNDRNIGFPQAVNQGLDAATGARIVVLNPDTEVPPDLLDALDDGLGPGGYDLVTCSQQGEDGVAAATGPELTVREIVGQVALRRRGDATFTPEITVGRHRFMPVRSGYLSGYCLAATAEVFRELGGLDPKLFWAEDVDLSVRAARSGRTLAVCTSVRVEHQRTYSVKRYRGLVTFFQLTGKIGYARRHHPRATWFVAAVVVLVALLRGGWFATVGSGTDDARSRVAAYRAVLAHVARRQWRLPDGWDPAVVDRLSTAADADRPGPWPSPLEWLLAVVAIVVFARSSVLFVRQRLVEHLGGPIGQTWQDDPLISSTFMFVELLALAVVVRKADWRELKHHVVLVVLLAYAFASMEWSIEPSTTQLRAFMLAGSAAAGWFLATRFSLRQQLDAVIAGGTVGILASGLAAVVLPDQARFTNGDAGQWSGIFVNRNLLALVICVTFLAMALRWWSASWNHRIVLIVIALVAAYLLLRTGARTAPVALLAGLAVAAVVAAVRRVLVADQSRLVVGGLSSAAVVAAGTTAIILASDRIYELLGREPTWNRRAEMRSIDRFYIDQRPWRGFGLEAIWTHPPIVNGVFEQFESYPYQAHQGYLEMQLSLGWIGLALLGALIAFTVVRGFRLAWTSGAAVALWPLAITAFVVVTNISESLFIANEVQWVLFVAAGFAGAGTLFTRETGGAGSPGSR